MAIERLGDRIRVRTPVTVEWPPADGTEDLSRPCLAPSPARHVSDTAMEDAIGTTSVAAPAMSGFSDRVRSGTPQSVSSSLVNWSPPPSRENPAGFDWWIYAGPLYGLMPPWDYDDLHNPGHEIWAEDLTFAKVLQFLYEDGTSPLFHPYQRYSNHHLIQYLSRFYHRHNREHRRPTKPPGTFHGLCLLLADYFAADAALVDIDRRTEAGRARRFFRRVRPSREISTSIYSHRDRFHIRTPRSGRLPGDRTWPQSDAAKSTTLINGVVCGSQAPFHPPTVAVRKNQRTERVCSWMGGPSSENFLLLGTTELSGHCPTHRPLNSIRGFRYTTHTTPLVIHSSML